MFHSAQSVICTYINCNAVMQIQVLNGVLRLFHLDLSDDSNFLTRRQTIFVSSDTQQTVIEELRDLRPQWNLVHLDYNKQSLQPSASPSSNIKGHNQELFNLLHSDRKFHETNMFLAELAILKEAHGVVCTFSSNVCRFIQLLRRQNEHSVLSLDITWLPN